MGCEFDAAVIPGSNPPSYYNGTININMPSGAGNYPVVLEGNFYGPGTQVTRAISGSCYGMGFDNAIAAGYNANGSSAMLLVDDGSIVSRELNGTSEVHGSPPGPCESSCHVFTTACDPGGGAASTYSCVCGDGGWHCNAIFVGQLCGDAGAK